MKLFLSSFVVLLLVVTVSYAQSGRPAMQRIHAAKMVYITDAMQLSEDQSTKFVPVYNEYEKELRGIRRSYFKKYDISQDDDMASRHQIEDDLDYQQQVIELKRQYNERFLKIISQKQLSDMYAAERGFRQVLIHRLQQQRRGGRKGGR